MISRIIKGGCVFRILSCGSEFSFWDRIYVELADQYRIIDAVSNVAKRNVLAGHLNDVIDMLDQKVREFPPSGPLGMSHSHFFLKIYILWRPNRVLVRSPDIP